MPPDANAVLVERGEAALRAEIDAAEPYAPAAPAGRSLLGKPAPLDEVYDYVARFIAYPDVAAQVAHTLWIAHTHAMDAWESTPRLAILSPEPGSGKTRVLEISELLVPRPVQAVNVTPAYLFRKVGDDAGRPTILFDEIDTVFGPKAKDNEEVRGLLNAGHRRGAVAGRCVVKGKITTTEEIPAYCAVALAGLGDLPDTIATRSIIIRMRRRADDQAVEAFRRRVHAPEGEALRDRLAEWMASVESELQGAYPDMPKGVTDRDADVWEPLLAIADKAGGDWPKRARDAAVALVTLSRDGAPSLGVRLLADVKEAFGALDAMTTQKLLQALHEKAEAPWNDLRGKPLNERKLAGFLKRYGVAPRTIRIDAFTTAKGYQAEDLRDPWKRYVREAVTELRL